MHLGNACNRVCELTLGEMYRRKQHTIGEAVFRSVATSCQSEDSQEQPENTTNVKYWSLPCLTISHLAHP